MSDSTLTGRVLEIQHFCTHDGPGIRTTIFFKGCSLDCKWCCNPESIRNENQLFYNVKKCIGIKECDLCIKSCPQNAITIKDEKVTINRTLCNNCSECTKSCPSKALNMCSRDLTVAEVFKEIEIDLALCRESGGGITLSGGECTLQADFAVELLKEAHSRGINTAIETAGNVPWKNFQKVLEHTDIILHDYKQMSSELHIKWIGADNKLALENFRRAYETYPNKKFIARTPLIANINDNEEHIRAVLDYILPYKNVIEYELLPYHYFGENKYTYIGKVYELKDWPNVDNEKLQQLRDMIAKEFKNR